MNGNAEIIKTMLGYSDYRILICHLYLDQNGTCQAFGGFSLDNYNPNTKEREPSIYAGYWIQKILKTVGVDTWEELVGKHVRVDGEVCGRIYGIGNITKDIWFYPNREKYA